MNELAFALVYAGARLDNGAMSVEELAPALGSLDDLVQEMSRSAFPTREPARLAVRGARDGSLAIDLVLQAPWDHIIDIFSSDGADAVNNLFGYLAGGAGILSLIRRLRRRRIAKVTQVDEPNQPVAMVELTLEDGEVLRIPAAVLDGYRKIKVRKSARTVVEPLEDPGIERVQIVREQEIAIEIARDDIAAFDPLPSVEEPVTDNVVDMVVAIASPSFTGGNKWRLSDGSTTFYASLDDESFKAAIDAGRESFRAGDMLRCRMEILQSRGGDGTLHTERRVLQVVEHIPREVQLQLVDDGDEGDEPSAVA
ncbi:MAG TPA: hypothetical protein VFT50_14510 [Baekduia sp.]|nr:hypothetical protein [Baekduia sp.]